MVRSFSRCRWVWLWIILVKFTVNAIINICEEPPLISHGEIKSFRKEDYYQPSDQIVIICYAGYTYTGSSQHVICEEEGVWSEEFGECAEVSCNSPEPLENGFILGLSEDIKRFPFNFEITYICNEGFRLVGGQNWRFCREDGWSGETPQCEMIQCPNPGAPENGERYGDEFGVGAKVEFKCFAGYSLVGSEKRYCMANGQWTGELTRCDKKGNYCLNPGVPVNGYKNSTRYEFSNRVLFGCHSGYTLLGSRLRTCLSNRKWTGMATKCIDSGYFDNSVHLRNMMTKMESKNDERAPSFPEEEHKKPLKDIFQDVIIIFIIDIGRTIGQENFNEAIEFAKAIVRRIGISPYGTRAGVLTFARTANIQILPVDFETTNDMLYALDGIKYTGHGSIDSTVSALGILKDQVIPLTQHLLIRNRMKFVVFFLTNGRRVSRGYSKEVAEILKGAGVEFYGIGITDYVDKNVLQEIASDREEEPRVFILKNYSVLAWLVQEITEGNIDYSQCGLRKGKFTEVFQGKNGTVKAVEPWPWMAALYFVPHGRTIPLEAKLTCGGTIIHEQFILTSAHCMFVRNSIKRKKEEIFVKLGLTNLKNLTSYEEWEVEDIFIHPKYHQGGENYDYDIALLLLKEPIIFNAFVRPICLPAAELPEDNAFYRTNEFGLATGWGHEESSPVVRLKVSENLKEISLPLQSRERCRQSLVNNRFRNPDDIFTDRMFCAGDGIGTDTCAGDGGGPLMQPQLNSDGYLQWTQVGIVSWGTGCGLNGTYGFYTHVQKLRQWIDETMENTID